MAHREAPEATQPPAEPPSPPMYMPPPGIWAWTIFGPSHGMAMTGAPYPTPLEPASEGSASRPPPLHPVLFAASSNGNAGSAMGDHRTSFQRALQAPSGPPVPPKPPLFDRRFGVHERGLHPKQRMLSEAREKLEGARDKSREKLEEARGKLTEMRRELWKKLKLADGQVPTLGEGQEIRVNDKGEFYKAAMEDGEEEEKRVQQAVLEKSISFWSSRATMERVFGLQITQFFNFLRFLTAINAIFVAVSLVAFVPHMRGILQRLQQGGYGTSDLPTSLSALDFLFLGSFQPSTDPSWNAFVITSCVVGTLSGPIYFLLATFYFKDFTSMQELSQTVQKDPKFDFRDPYKVDLTPEQDRQRIAKRRRRMAQSYALFCFILSVPVVIMYSLLIVANGTYVRGMEAMQSVSTPYNEAARTWNSQQFITGILCSVTVVTFNNLFELVVSAMTEYETHRRWSEYRKHRLWKLLVFRFVNVSALFIIRYFGEVPWFACMVNRMALQAFLLIITDLTVTNLYAILFPVVLVYTPAEVWGFRVAWWKDKAKDAERAAGMRSRAVSMEGGALSQAASGGGGGGASMSVAVGHRADFELTDEYLILLFRQYCMYCAFTTFPLVSLVALMSTLFDHIHTKFRLVNLCRKPRGYFMGGRKKLTYWLIYAFIAGTVTFPVGSVWFVLVRGPFLCWPCPSYSRKAGGPSLSLASLSTTCSTSFEEPFCTDQAGAPLTTYQISSRINILKALNPLSPAWKEAADWMDANTHLFNHRRCACRPCNLAIACPCAAPALDSRVCSSLSGAFANASSSSVDSSPSGSSISTPLVDAMSPIAGVNATLVWRAAHCDRTRATYSREESLQHKSLCLGGKREGQPCQEQEDCDEGLCERYCPSELVQGADGSLAWQPYPRCWLCPEDMTGGFVDPGAAKAAWENLGFCSRCTSPGITESCVCSKTCSPFQ